MYTVLFTRRARDELAQAWLDAESATRAAISAASDVLERQLRLHPHEVGESRDGGRRIAFGGPLGIVFKINDADRKVVVLHVWRNGRTAN